MTGESDAPDEPGEADEVDEVGGGSGATRTVVRVAVALLAIVVMYGAVTFAQVWRATDGDEVASADAILVLGAAQYDGRPSPVLERRLAHALALWERGVAERIVVTGGRQSGDTFTEATASYNWLRDRGVPDEAILKEVDGRSTYESLAAAARFLKPAGMDKVVLVSDGYHAKRAVGTAAEVGLDARVSTVETGRSPARTLLRETVAVGVGRIIGYGRLTRWTG